MVEEMDDDFGDLYADVELQVSAATKELSGFNQLYIEHDDNKNESSSVDDRVASELRSKKVSSISRELTLCSKDDATIKNGNLIENVMETPNLEANGEEELVVDSGSDSEDDLHIVLNEDDCRKYPVGPVPRDAVAGNRGLTEGSDDEDDDFVIVTDAKRPSNDRNLLDQIQSSCDGLEQAALSSGAEKGNGMKCCHLSQYSQYKYIRPVNLKGSGSGAAFPVSSPLPGKGNWDVNGSNQQMVSSMPHVTSSSSTVIPFVAQRGYDFSLPRYRTILDVNIDSLEWKPWRQPGTDITDFFNFDLDEESWKEYCNCLEHFRQQANMLAKAPESLRLNQAYGIESEHATVAPESLAGESGQIGDGTKVSLSFKSADRGGKRPELPKGRAIQVEGGIGERKPSMDLRRPQNRDSDVIIQIAVHDSSEDSTGSSEREGHVYNSVPEMSKSRDSGTDCNIDMHDSGVVHNDTRSIEPVDEYTNGVGISHFKDYGARHWTRCSQRTATSTALALDSDAQVNEHIYDVDRHHHPKPKVHVFEDKKMAVRVEQTKEAVVNRIPSKTDPCMLEGESSPGNQNQCSLSSSYLDGHSEEPNDGTDALKALDRPSSNSAAELWESVASDNDNPKDSESNGSDMESGECKYGSEDQSPNYVKQNGCSRMQLRSVAELKDHRDDDDSTLISDRKDRYGGDRPKVSHGTHKQWRRNTAVYDRKKLSYYRGTEVSSGCHSDTPVDRCTRNSCTENLHGIPQHLEEEMDSFPTRHWDEKDYLSDQRITAEYSIRENYLHGREHTKDRIKSISFKKSRSLSGLSSHYKEKARNPWQRTKRDEKSQYRKRILDESEHRCMEELQQKYGRYVPYDDREPFRKKYDRHIPYVGRETERSGKINRYRQSPRPELDTSWSSAGYDDEFWRHPDHQCTAVDTCREFEVVKERQWQDITSPRNDTSDSRRFDERSYDNWRQIKHRDSWLDPMCENAYHVEDDAIYLDDDICKKRRRSSRRFETFHWDENKLCSRHQVQDDMYAEEAPSSFKRNKWHERIHVEREPTHQHFVLNEQIGSKIIREEIRISEISNHRNSGINIICRVKHEQAALRSRDSALGGWEGKPSGRCSKVGDVRSNGGHSRMDQVVDNEQMVFGHSDEAHTREAILPYRSKVESRISRSKTEVRQCRLKPSPVDEKWLEKYPVAQCHEASDLEEGQLAEETEKKEICAIEQKHVSGSVTGTGDVKGGRVKVKDFGNEEKGMEVYENSRILEALVKMEKRRERFKEPIPLKEPGKSPKPEPAPTTETAVVKRSERFKEQIPLKNPVKNPKPEPPPTVETAEIKQQRPLRKRRWAGS